MGLDNTPKSWAYNSRGEFDLLRVFVAVAEKKIEESSSIIRQLVKKEQTEFEIEQHDGSVVTHAVDVRNIGKINDIDFDLDCLLGKTFPNHERRSFLITIYGMFEYELSKFCKRYCEYSGINEGLKSSEKINKSKSYIRNYFAHNYGLLDVGNSTAVDYVKESDLLCLAGDSVFIKPGFLKHFCDLCFQYFSRLEGQARAL